MKSEAIFPNHANVDLPFVIHAIGSAQKQIRRKRDEGNVNTQIIYGESGEGRLTVDGKTYDILPGTCFFLPRGVPHDYWPVGEKEWRTNWLCFEGSCLDKTLENLGLQCACVVELPDPTRMDALFKNIMSELHADHVFGQLRASSHVYRLLTELHLIKREQIEQQFRKTPKLDPVLEYIEAHVSDVITLEELAAQMNLTPQHFCRVFKDAVGERPFQYILKRRIQISKRYLVRPEMRISEVGQKVGIENSSYFCYNFKRLEGMTPTEFRAMYAE